MPRSHPCESHRGRFLADGDKTFQEHTANVYKLVQNSYYWLTYYSRVLAALIETMLGLSLADASKLSSPARKDGSEDLYNRYNFHKK